MKASIALSSPNSSARPVAGSGKVKPHIASAVRWLSVQCVAAVDRPVQVDCVAYAQPDDRIHGRYPDPCTGPEPLGGVRRRSGGAVHRPGSFNSWGIASGARVAGVAGVAGRWRGWTGVLACMALLYRSAHTALSSRPKLHEFRALRVGILRVLDGLRKRATTRIARSLIALRPVPWNFSTTISPFWRAR